MVIIGNSNRSFVAMQNQREIGSSRKKSSVIKNVLSRGTIHGLKYLLDDRTTYWEKVFWMLVFTSALFGAACHLQKVWETYNTHLTRTTIISTYFKYANIPFPSVTVCDNSRVDWHRVDKLNLSDFFDDCRKISNEDHAKIISDLKLLLAAISTVQFGAPKDLNHLKTVYNLRSLKEVHISRLLREVFRRCEQVFEPHKCWWRTSYYRCCDLFELQKTGYGYCYSFNSDISEKSKLLSLNYGLNGDQNIRWTDWNGQVRPRRSAGHGPWSGLRFTVQTQKIPSYVNAKPGVIVIVGDPSGFPFENDVFVPSGKVGNIGVRGDALRTTDRLRKLSPSKRRCLFPDESRTLFRGYLRQNCIANCYRKFVQSNCKCSLDFIYYQIQSNSSVKLSPCRMKHLTCLADYNYAFINHLSEESINDDSSSSPFCKCPDDCQSQKYLAKLSTVNSDSAKELVCDVHFEMSFCSLYRTDISFDYMDAIASYGGIVELFLGASLLSLAEILFQIVKKVVSYILKKHKRMEQKIDNTRVSFIAHDERPVLEKIFWGCLLFGAFCGAITSVRQIWLHYTRSSTETVVETTYYKYSQIAFPAVVICEASRVDWKRVLELNQSIVQEYTDETKPAIIALLRILAGIEFGEFDEFENLIPYKNVFGKLKTLRISELLLKVSRNCEEIFVGKCWWRSHEIDCCLLFERQKTEFGYCYSFNSDLSEYSKKLSVVKDGINSYWRDPDGVLRPRRTGSRGQWSGLRVSVNTPPVSQLPPGTAIKPGMTVLVGEPRSFVMGGEITIGAGQYGNVHIWGDRIHSTERLRDLDLNKRQCLYSDEAEALGLPYYTRQNCKVDCHKYHTFKYCNCTPDFMFFESNENNPTYPPCTVQDLLCLNKYNSIFNNLLPNFAHSFFGENETGMFCDCKADCNHQMYIAEVTVADESNSSQEVLLDIHFRQSTCILYRSDVMIGMLDLLVMFGGCTGLFLGGSLLSCVELIYFVTLRLYFQWKNWRNTNLAVDVETRSSERSTNN